MQVRGHPWRGAAGAAYEPCDTLVTNMSHLLEQALAGFPKIPNLTSHDVLRLCMLDMLALVAATVVFMLLVPRRRDSNVSASSIDPVIRVRSRVRASGHRGG
jgi:hypothetical protein